MSIHNRLATRWNCPICHTSQDGLIFFQYGPCTGEHFEIGQNINWNQEGVIYEKRPDGGIATVEGVAECKNKWKLKWLRKIGAIDDQGRGTGAVAPGISWPPEGHSIPPIEERRKFGCPDALIVNIIIVNDRIERLQWPTNEKDLVVNEY